MIGQTVLHYEILEKLGEGGMGQVWKAKDTRLDRFVALKFLPETTSEDPATVERFLREARAASALNHPGICTIHDIGEWEGRRYIVMEYVEGMTLGERAAAGPLPTETLVEVGIQLADALDAAHAKHIIHRDIKSTNIILSPRRQAKILDFGLAKIVQGKGRGQEPPEHTVEVDRDLTDAGQAVGTVSYMSPEQALGKDVDGRTDLFSLGVVLYEMATGRRAFPGSTTAAIFDAILNQAPTSPVTLNRDIPPELERIISKMLEKDRDLRYQSAEDLRTDLKRLRRDGSSASVSTPVVPTQRSGTGRKLGIGLALAAVLAAGLWFFLGRGGDALTLAGPLTPRVLTSLVGVEESGTWSPDGGFFAFSHSASGPADIYVKSLGGGDPVQLGVSDADDTDPRWSPDNRWIAFASNRGGAWSMYLIPPLGGDTQKLVDLGVHGLFLGAGSGAQAWSPNGRFYLYSKRDSTGAQAVWKIDVETRVETKLTTPPPRTEDTKASWSFDGERIAFLRWTDGGPTIRVMDATGNDQREVISTNPSWLPEGHPGVTNPAWTPDSRHLVVEAAIGVGGIWMIRVGTNDAVQLVSGSLGSGNVSISSNGRLLYNTYEHQTDLYLQDLQTGEQRRLTSHTQDNFEPRISSDGTRVVYTSSRTGDPEIWVLDLESGRETRLTNHDGPDGGADWSPDGREVVFSSTRPVEGEPVGVPHLWTVPAEGGVPRLLSASRGSQRVRWSPSGERIGAIVWADEGPNLWMVDRGSGSAELVLEAVAGFDWYRSDRWVVVSTYQGTGQSEMRAVDLETGKHVTLLTDPHLELAVAPDGSAVSYCSAVSHYNMNLHVLRLAPGADGLPRPAGPPETITHGDGEWHVHNGGWSPDAKFVSYTRDTDKADIYALEGVFAETP